MLFTQRWGKSGREHIAEFMTLHQQTYKPSTPVHRNMKPAVSWPMVPPLLLGLCLAFVVVFFPPDRVFGEDLLPQPDIDNSPWHITADELSYIESEDVYVAEGDVVVEKNDRRIAADYARFDQKAMEITAKGHVVMSVGNDILTADSLAINLATEKGVIQNGAFFLEKYNFHIKGNQIRKTGKNSYQVDKASITTCNGDKPAWKITGRHLNVTIEGYGSAYHATFWVKSVPVMYTPFIAFPVKLKRQTGLLSPQVATSSRKGFQYIQPFFWAINESADATFYEHYMASRGNKLGTEFRYVFSPVSKGTLMFDYLEDKEIDDGTGNSSQDWGYDDTLHTGSVHSGDILRPNHDRYWFRMKQDQELPAGLVANVDLDVVSDQDYLQEFKSGYTGFRDTRDYFNDEFGRDIDDYNDPIRLNRFNVNRRWSRYSFNTEFRWYDDVISRRQGGPDTTVQRLPAIRFDASKQPLLQSPFYFTLDSEYTYFYREDALTTNQVTRDHRVDVNPRIYLPFSLGHYVALEPSLGFRETYWYVDAYDDGVNGDESFHRELVDGRVNLSTEFYRIFKTDGEKIDRLKHTLNPQIIYTYLPELNQEDYPNFDSVDRIARQNQVTYSLTNLLIYRSRQPLAAAAEKPSYGYRQFLRFFLSQQYDFNEASEKDPSKWKNGTTQEPFSPVYGKLEITPEAYYVLTADGEWSVYGEGLIARNLAVSLSDQRGDQLFVEHRFQKDIDQVDQNTEVESIFSSLLLKISDRLSATGEYERDIYDQNDLLISLGTLYQSQCWSLRLKYTHEGDEQKYAFMIGLQGLGDMGGNL